MGDVELPTMFFIEQVCLPDAKGAKMIKDPNYNDLVYCKSDSRVFKVDASGIVDSIANGSDIDSAGSCKVDWIVNAISLSPR